MQFYAVKLGESIDEVCSCNRFSNAVLPSPAFHKIIKKKRDDVIRLKEYAVFVHDSEAIRVAVSGNPDMGFGGAHLFAQCFEKMIVGLGGMSAKQDVAVVVHGRNFYAGFFQKRIGIATTCSPHRVENNAELRFL